MEKFLFNYINQFETVLMYIKSTREGDGDLHLHSLFELLKYFFAHNNLNLRSSSMSTIPCVPKNSEREP